MGLTGRSLTTGVLIAISAAFFIPVFADAAAGFDGGSWAYANQLQTVFNQFPLIVGLLALVVLGGALFRAS